MDKLKRIAAFRKVVERGSFATAARDLGLSPSTLTKYVGQLEAELGIALLARTTRRLALTEAGAIYLERATKILELVDEAEQVAVAGHAQVRGLLRIAAPMSFGIVSLDKVIANFMTRFPELRVDVVLSDSRAELLEEGFDLAVRIAPNLSDSSLRVRRLGVLRRSLLASPAYVERRGAPTTPAELAEHELLVFTGSGEFPQWHFRRDGANHEIVPRARLQVNNSLALKGALLAGQGVTLAPEYLFEEELRVGALVRLLDEYEPDRLVVHAVYPALPFVPLKIRVFVDHLVASYTGE